MEKSLATLGKGTTCLSWNYCGQRLAAGSIDGVLSIYDCASSSSTCVTSKVSEFGIEKVVWVRMPSLVKALLAILLMVHLHSGRRLHKKDKN
ncbi:hypothetical protein QQ045_012235 [Rhodiola kirilowii]